MSPAGTSGPSEGGEVAGAHRLGDPLLVVLMPDIKQSPNNIMTPGTYLLARAYERQTSDEPR
jgi:hypothetical protein